MADRDRLAALLDDALSAMDDEWTVREMADFLIDAGVGFPDARLRDVHAAANSVAEAASIVITNNYAPTAHYDLIRWGGLVGAVEAWREAQHAALGEEPTRG